MKKYKMTIVLMAILLITSCSDAMVASANLSKAADQFEIYRRVVFYNGITGSYILQIDGYCSIEIDKMDGQLEVTVKTAPGKYLKHYLGLSDNVTYFAEQLNTANVRVDKYRVIFKPSIIIPNVEIK